MSAVLRVPLRTSTVLKSNSKFIHNTQILNISKSNIHFQENRVSPFSVKGIFKHYELLPLVGIVAVGTVALGAYAVYFCKTRNDVQFRKQAAYDPMDLQKPPVLKMKETIDYKEYRHLEELDNLYKEMAQAEHELKNANK